MTAVTIEIELPEDMVGFGLPPGVNQRLQALLDRQDSGTPLSASENEEAEGLVELSEWLSLLRMRAERAGMTASPRQ